jgi:formylglycine-generating enzyme required for sulfatase activity
MSKRRKLSRREFLKMVGTTASAAALGACVPIPTKVAPTATPVPTPEEIEPIVPEMVLVEVGSFQMGSTDGAPNEQPVHTVHITKPFYIAKYAVTFEEYDRFCDDQKCRRPQDNGWGRGTRPVFGVSWLHAVKYCDWLSGKEVRLFNEWVSATHRGRMGVCRLWWAEKSGIRVRWRGQS